MTIDIVKTCFMSKIPSFSPVGESIISFHFFFNELYLSAKQDQIGILK